MRSSSAGVSGPGRTRTIQQNPGFGPGFCFFCSPDVNGTHMTMHAYAPKRVPFAGSRMAVVHFSGKGG